MFLLQLIPEKAEEYVEYLISIGRLDEAAVKMADIVNDVSLEECPLLPHTLINAPASPSLSYNRTSLSQERGSQSISCGKNCVFSSLRTQRRSADIDGHTANSYAVCGVCVCVCLCVSVCAGDFGESRPHYSRGAAEVHRHDWSALVLASRLLHKSRPL